MLSLNQELSRHIKATTDSHTKTLLYFAKTIFQIYTDCYTIEDWHGINQRSDLIAQLFKVMRNHKSTINYRIGILKHYMKGLQDRAYVEISRLYVHELTTS